MDSVPRPWAYARWEPETYLPHSGQLSVISVRDRLNHILSSLQCPPNNSSSPWLFWPLPSWHLLDFLAGSPMRLEIKRAFFLFVYCCFPIAIPAGVSINGQKYHLVPSASNPFLCTCLRYRMQGHQGSFLLGSSSPAEYLAREQAQERRRCLLAKVHHRGATAPVQRFRPPCLSCT